MNKEDELVLVVPTQDVTSVPWKGLKNLSEVNLEAIIKYGGQFLRRGDVEHDLNWKQIIPYLIFSYQDKLFLMQRGDQNYEKRHALKFSLGIGGHINKEDLVGENIMDWAKREFEEEIEYQGKYQAIPLGILNDVDDISSFHLGYVILLKGDSDQIKIKDEFISGKLATREEIKQHYNLMESWSQLVFDYLISSQNDTV